MKNPLVSVIVVNWNGGEVFENCLMSLVKIKSPRWELVVVDNGSKDGSDKLVRKYVKDAKVLRNKHNVGFAKANNQGYELSIGEYILLLNNDTKVKSDLLNTLVERLKGDSSLGVIQPKIRFMDDPSILDNSGAFLTKTGYLQHWGFGKKDSEEFNKEREVFSTKGACMMIKREVINKVGLFDEEFVSYMEESDFCWRVWLAGWHVLYHPKTDILHKVGMTSKKLGQLEVNFHSMKNRVRMLLKNLSITNLFFILGWHVFLTMGLSVYYLVTFQVAKATMIWKSFYWNIVNIGETLRLRHKVQSQIRRRSDKSIFKKILVSFSIKEMFNHFVHVESTFS